MGEPLQVLIVEDSEDDAALIIRNIRQGGYDPLHVRVESAAEMESALRSRQWDVILCDYTLPRFSGLQALSLFMDTALDIPFLIISGKIGEDTAVEAMRAGAQDYIMKDRLQRLVPAIRRELQEAEGRRLRRRTEAALLESEVHYRELVSRMSSAVVIYTAADDGSDFIIKDFNLAAERIEKVGKADVVGKSVSDVFPGILEYGLFDVIKRVWKTGRPEHLPASFYKDDRIAGWRDSYVYMLSSGEVVAVYDDVTTQRRLEEDILKAATEWSATFDAMNESVSLLDSQATILRANNSTCNLIGKPFKEIIGRKCCELIHGTNDYPGNCPFPRMVKSLRREESDIFQNERWFHVIVDPIFDVSGQMERAVHILSDITAQKNADAELRKKHEELEAAHEELKQAQARVIQQEKMASIGQLASGITHEINNPMSFITGNLGILKNYLEGIIKIMASQQEIAGNHAPPETMEALRDLRKKMKIDYILNDVGNLIAQSLEGAERVRKIVSDLKTFSRMEDDVWVIEDINAALDSTINIVWNEIKYKAELVKELKELPLTSCNISHLNQVFMNLLVNAAQSIEQRGKITVRTWKDEYDIYVSVTDTGSGIPEENLNKIFHPFFTTKAAGKGTGLGLSISYDIVKRHNGNITVESKIGEGSTFTVRIPIVRSS